MLACASKFEVCLRRFYRQIRRTTTSKSYSARHCIVVKGLITNGLQDQVGKDSLLASCGRKCLAIRTLTISRVFYLATYHSITSKSNFCLVNLGRLARFKDDFSYFIRQEVQVSVLVVRRVTLYVRTSGFASHARSKISNRRPLLSR